VANLLSFLLDGLGLAYLFLVGLLRIGTSILFTSLLTIGSCGRLCDFLIKNHWRGFCIVFTNLIINRTTILLYK
jgi:hypothetical protein